MRVVKVQDKELEVIDKWDEFDVEKYIQIVKLYAQLEELGNELFLVKFIVILTGEAEDWVLSLYDEDLLVFTDLIESFKLDEFRKKEQRKFELNGNTYAINSMNRLTLGEKISIKLLEKEAKDEYETWINLLSILIRPAEEVKNEFGEVEYKVEKFVGDIATIKKRKELVKKIPATSGMWILESFMPGSV